MAPRVDLERGLLFLPTSKTGKNAVPALVAEAIGRAIRAQLLGNPAKGRKGPKLLPPRRPDMPPPGEGGAGARAVYGASSLSDFGLRKRAPPAPERAF